MSEGKLTFESGSWADLPTLHVETAEEAYRRGYQDGYMVAAYHFAMPRQMGLLERFVYGPLMDWVARARRKLIRGEDGKMHYDSHQPAAGFEAPPSIGPG